MKNIALTLLLYIITLNSYVMANENISLQLAWKHQFQSVGYYMAKEKGYYNDVGLDVNIKEYDARSKTTDDIINEKIEFAVGRSSLIHDRLEGKPVVMLASIFQHSPLILLTKQREDLQKISDFKNKSIMLSNNHIGLASINAMLLSSGIKQDMYKIQPNTFNIDDLINDKTDAVLAYTSNEPFALKQKGIEYKIFSPKEFGFDFYSDILFTSQALIQKKPVLVKNFREASLKGWAYAMNNPDEAVKLILDKYNTQNKSEKALDFEAKTMIELIDYKNTPIGDISKKRVEEIANIYKLMGFVKNNFSLDKLLYINYKSTQGQKNNTLKSKVVKIKLNLEEKKWIKEHTVKIGGESDWAPFDFIKDGKYQGISKDFVDIISQKSGLKVEYVTGQTWVELLADFKSGKLDILPAIYHTKSREAFTEFTKPYFKITEYAFARSDDDSINSIDDLKDKKVAVIDGYSIIEHLQEEFPNINLLRVKSLSDGIDAVLFKKADVYIDAFPVVSYVLASTMQTGVKPVLPLNFYSSELYIGVNKSAPILASIFKKGLDSISVEEKNKIFKKWTATEDKQERTIKIKFTKKEQAWIDKKIPIRYVYDPGWAPFEWKNELEKHTGMLYDIINIISSRSDIEFVPVGVEKWSDAVQKAKSKEVDMYSGVSQTAERLKYMQFTKKSIYKAPYVFVTRMDDKSDYLDLFKSVKDKKIAVVDGYAIHNILLVNEPKIPLITVGSTINGFEKLRDESIDVFIVNAATAKYYLNTKGFSDLRVAAKTEYNLDLKISIRKDWPKEVISIIDKAMSIITEKELDDIYLKWTQVQFKEKTNWKLIFQITGVGFLVFAFIIYNNRKLKKLVGLKTRELRSLLESFDANVIASNTDTKGKITYVSDAFCEISGYSREELLGKPHNISRHPDMPKEAFKDLWQTIKAGKTWTGEVKNIKKDGGYYWVDAVVNPLYNEKDEIIGYSSIRNDITAKKEVQELSASLEQKVEDRTADLNTAKQEVEEIHKHTRESIEYAALIQGALIPDNQIFRNFFSDYFAIWHPKDIVGGDIYLMNELNEDELIIMVIDCTGHGVPGAFVTMLVKAIERQLMANIHKDKTISPAKILSIFNKSIKNLLKQESVDSVSNAGFDGGIIYYNKKEKIIKFAGAETALFYVEDEELKTIKGSRHSVGYKKSDANFEFKEHTIKVKEGMKFYCTTDGYLDQNGGEKGFPFGKKRFSKIIQENHNEQMADQQELLLYKMDEYEKMVENNDRNDDMTVVGFTI